VIRKKSFFVFHIFLGFVILALGILGFLAQFELEFFIPSAVFSATFLEIFILLVGIFFIREAVQNKKTQERFVHFIIGFSLFFFSLFPLFVSLGILKFLPYYIDLDVSPFVLSLLLFCSGIYMILDRIFLLVSE